MEKSVSWEENPSEYWQALEDWVEMRTMVLHQRKVIQSASKGVDAHAMDLAETDDEEA
jgi:hypothetical protein